MYYILLPSLALIYCVLVGFLKRKKKSILSASVIYGLIIPIKNVLFDLLLTSSGNELLTMKTQLCGGISQMCNEMRKDKNPSVLFVSYISYPLYF